MTFAMLLRTVFLTFVAIVILGCGARVTSNADRADQGHQQGAQYQQTQNQQSAQPTEKEHAANVTLYLAGMNQELQIL